LAVAALFRVARKAVQEAKANRSIAEDKKRSRPQPQRNDDDDDFVGLTDPDSALLKLLNNAGVGKVRLHFLRF
jgi:hypothetical protein